MPENIVRDALIAMAIVAGVGGIILGIIFAGILGAWV